LQRPTSGRTFSIAFTSRSKSQRPATLEGKLRLRISTGMLRSSSCQCAQRVASTTRPVSCLPLSCKSLLLVCLCLVCLAYLSLRDCLCVSVSVLYVSLTCRSCLSLGHHLIRAHATALSVSLSSLWTPCLCLCLSRTVSVCAICALQCACVAVCMRCCVCMPMMSFDGLGLRG
jgi:hypothetical protein